AASVAQEKDAPRRAPHGAIEGVLQPREPLVVHAAAAEEVRRQGAFRVVAPALPREADAGDAQRLDAPLHVGRDLPLDPDEVAATRMAKRARRAGSAAIAPAPRPRAAPPVRPGARRQERPRRLMAAPRAPPGAAPGPWRGRRPGPAARAGPVPRPRGP